MARVRPPSPVEGRARACADQSHCRSGGEMKPARPLRTFLDDASTSDGTPQPRPHLVPRISPKKTTACKQIKLTSLGSLASATMLQRRDVDDDAVRPKRSAARRLEFMHESRQGRKHSLDDARTEMTGRQIVDDSEAEGSSYSNSATSDAETSDDDSLPSLDQIIGLPRRKVGRVTPTMDDPSFIAKQLSALSLRGTLNAPEPRSRPTAQKLDTPSRPTRPTKNVATSSKLDYSSDKENNGGVLYYSPPRLCTSPPKKVEVDRPVTPPPPKSDRPRLQSPSKSRARVPTPPLRQSLDAFWSPNEINTWNDQYSPQKTLRSPKKLSGSRETPDISPSASPKKSQSPSKRTKAEVAARKDFEAQKHRLAEAFLLELDDAVAEGQIRQLAASTGGVRIIWSKTLNSTAGRANWRRETIRMSRSDGHEIVTHKHHASIELAEKVIDDADRLLNVIAHEFCHLCNFMISGIKDQPHGAQFKAWGRKCTLAFRARGVKVTTTHAYAIDYKYVWQCSNEDCAAEFKRHSKSIDPARHTCGSCRSRIVQIKPVPRKYAGGAPKGYAAFVKEHFALVRREMPGASQKEVMEAIGRKYRAEKPRALASEDGDERVPVSPSRSSKVVDVEKVAVMLEVIAIDDDDA